MNGIILASASPRRCELLGRLGVSFEVTVPDIDETLEEGEAPESAAERLARAKAAAVAETSRPVLAADTIVAVAGRTLGKPVTTEEATAMLALLAGTEHSVMTAVALRVDGETQAALAVTRVWFRRLEIAEIKRYAATREARGAAGGYAVQGGAAAFVSRVYGSYSNVVGLPLTETVRLLGERL